MEVLATATMLALIPVPFKHFFSHPFPVRGLEVDGTVPHKPRLLFVAPFSHVAFPYAHNVHTKEEQKDCEQIQFHVLHYK